LLAGHPCFLFNATLVFSKAELCHASAESSSTQHSAVDISSSSEPVEDATLCEILQGISNDQCKLVTSDSSCQVVECNVLNNYYRITLTFLPCGGTPGVEIDVYHLREESTLLHDMFTTSQLQTVRLQGETRLFDLEVILLNSTDHITFMVSQTRASVGGPANLHLSTKQRQETKAEKLA